MLKATGKPINFISGGDPCPHSPASDRPCNLRVAIVHYWFTGRAGGERVVEALADLFPQADLFSLIADPQVLTPTLRNRKLTTSFLQRLPWIQKYYRHTLALQPLALEQFDLRNYDLIISSESGPAKGVITSPSAIHVCYCHSPMRYIWDLYPSYIANMSSLTRWVFAIVSHRVRIWDYAAAARVDFFVCNSNYVASRIKKFYRRDATVIPPPVDVISASICEEVEDYYLAVGRFVDYKRFDLVITACNQLQRPLKIVGSGPEYPKLKRLAGPTVEFLGKLAESEKNEVFRKCRALLFPGEEDFGIVPVEAQAHGRPVIAFGVGGALETIRGLPMDGEAEMVTPTGIFFSEQSSGSLASAILRFEANEAKFEPKGIRAHALQFDKSLFMKRMSVFFSGIYTSSSVESYRLPPADHGGDQR